MDREINIICQECKKPIGETHGSLWLPRDAVMAYQDAYAAWKGRHTEDSGDGGTITYVSGAAIEEYPDTARWTAHHNACDSADVDDMYSIPAYKLRTWADFVSWTAHLMEKRWLTDTNWRDLMRSVAGGESELLVPVTPPGPNAI